eukprot:TRINITY_DN1438_c0_g1_i1.p1 TRINITY_DN1438_c0_g1~~TRINITY_DN1438_c0_g1_i1.p1  ORF type:complete len:456 (+),score=88.28 TRINITY_DN1438_c0_g1_i1:85-1452(+)
MDEHKGCLGPEGSVVVLGFAFCFVYLAFNGAQNLQTSSTETIGGVKLGDWSLGLMYLGNTVSGIAIAAPACARTTDRNAILYWILAIPLFIAANVVYPKYALLPASVLAGISSGVHITAAFGYLSSCVAWRAAPEKTAWLTGVFYSLMQTSQILGNLASSVMLHTHHHGSVNDTVSTDDDNTNMRWLAVLYVTSCIVGYALFFALPNLPRETGALTHVPLLAKITGMARLVLRDRRMPLLVLLFVFSGFKQNFLFGIFTKQITAELGHSDKDVGYIMASFGGADAVGSALLGLLASRAGGGVVVALSSVCCAVGSMLLVVWEHEHTFASLSGLAVVLGLGDAGWNAIIVSTLSTLYPKERRKTPPATSAAASDVAPDDGDSDAVLQSMLCFSTYIFFQSGTTGVAFLYQSYATLLVLIAVFMASLLCAVISYTWLAHRHLPKLRAPEASPLLHDS